MNKPIEIMDSPILSNNQIDKDNFELGNTSSTYFYYYSLSILEKKDFTYINLGANSFIKALPTFIPFDNNIFIEFEKKGITLEKLNTRNGANIWYCDDIWILDMWKILKPIANRLFDKVFKENHINNLVTTPIIHFRCSDIPFMRHSQYYFQIYRFFKIALEKYDFSKDKDKTVILMACFKHNTSNYEEQASEIYTMKLQNYINSLGYNCIIQTKSNTQDFVDLFYAPYVISTGSSFSFMSGFSGMGKFISTEHCRTFQPRVVFDNSFLYGYNIPHHIVENYYDIDSTEKILLI